MEWITGPFNDVMKDVNRVTDKSTLYALRATGRLVVRKAKGVGPVYPGEKNQSTSPDPRAEAEAGNLKKSISNSRAIQHIGTGDYSMKVGPFGRSKKGTAVTRTGPSRKKGGTGGQVRGVPLYRAQAEDLYGFMAAGLAAAGPEMRTIYEDALAKAYERFK